jgi:hypothetical protein
MSIWAVNWALNTDISNTTHKFVLVALANFADDEDEAWPHIETIATMVSAGKRTVFRALEELEADGWLTRRPGFARGAYGGGLRQVNSVYRLELPETVTRRKGRGSARPQVIGDPADDRSATHGTTVAAGESPSEIRCDTGDTPDSEAQAGRGGVGESPSEIRCDTGDTPDFRGDTGDASGVTLVTPPYKENPSDRTTNLTPLTPHAVDGAGSGSGQVGQDEETNVVEAGGGAADAAAPPPEHGPAWSWDGAQDTEPAVDADWALMRDCLPEPMQALDGPTVTRVAGLLRERVAAGWTPDLLHATLAGNELPKQVHRLGGLVVTRLREIPVEGAPRRRPVPTPKPAPPATGPRFWLAFQVAQKRAELLGLPDAQRPRFWWMQQPGGVAATAIPLTTDLEAAVRALIATEVAETTPANTLEIV